MSSVFPLNQLIDVCENLDSKRIPITQNKRIAGEIPYYGASGVVDYVQDYLFDEELLLVSEDGANLLARTYPIAFSIKGKTWVNNHAHVLRFEQITTQRFVEYYLNSIKLDDYVSGMAQPKLNQKSLNSIRIPIPPLPEQKQIIAILDQAFAAIDQAKANIEKNIQNAKELFQSKLNEIFSQKGEGWEEIKFGELIKLRSGDGLTAKNMITGEYPVYGGNGIAGFHNDFNLEGENLVIGRVGALCGNVRYIKQKIWLTDNAFRITSVSKEIDNEFLMYLLDFKDLRSYARQAAQPVISNSSLQDVKLRFPQDIEIQKRIVELLKSLGAKLTLSEKQYLTKTDSLKDLKKSILQKAFAGELTGEEVASDLSMAAEPEVEYKK